jgi:hypothetical protein
MHLMAQPAPSVEFADPPSHDHIVVLDGVSWADYQRLLARSHQVSM